MRYYGPAEYQHLFSNWRAVGFGYRDPIPKGQALTDEELDYMKKREVKFGQSLGAGGGGLARFGK